MRVLIPEVTHVNLLVFSIQLTSCQVFIIFKSRVIISHNQSIFALNTPVTIPTLSSEHLSLYLVKQRLTIDLCYPTILYTGDFISVQPLISNCCAF